MFVTLALRNILRHKARTGVTLAAIVMGVVGLILSAGFVEDIILQLGEAIIRSQTGHLQVFRKNFLEKGTRQPTSYLVSNPKEVAASFEALPEVEQVMSRVAFSGLLNNGKRDLAIVGEGVEPAKEAKVGTYLTLVAGRKLEDADTYGILLGQGVAQALGVRPGDNLTLMLNTGEGALNTVDFTVVGIFQTFSKDFDARAVRISLAAAHELLATTGVNLIVVMLKDTDATEIGKNSVAGMLGARDLEVRTWRELSDFYEKSVEMYKRQFGVLRIIVLLMVLLSVANSVNMTLFERTREFGTMRAIGNQPQDVFRLIMLEGVVLGVAGAVGGIVLGCLLGVGISAVGIPMPPPPNANVGYLAHIRLTFWEVVQAGLIGLIATALAAVIPARRAANLPIVDALRQGV